MVHRSGSTLIIAPNDADRKKQLKNNIRTNEAKIFTDSQNIPEFLDELDQCAVTQEANKKQSLPQQQQQSPIKTNRLSRSTIQNRSPCKTLTTPKKAARERRSDNTDDLSQDIKESTSPIRIRSGLRSHSLESSNVIRTNNDDSTQSSQQQPLPARRGRKFKKKRMQGNNAQLGGAGGGAGRICNIQNATELSTELPQKLTCSLPLDRLSGFLDAILSRHCRLANDNNSTLEDAQAQTDTSSSTQQPVVVDASDSKGHSSNHFMTKSLCLYCDKKFSSQKVRTKHTERVHAITKGRRLSSRNSLSCPSNLSYPGCSYCCYNSNKLKTVTVSEDLKMLFHHLVDYHADKYFACKICAIRFSIPEELEEHIAAKHKLIGGNPIKIKGAGMVKRGRNSSLDSSNLVRLETAVSQLLHVDTGCSDNKSIGGNLDDSSMDPESTPTKTRRQLKQAMENKPLSTRSCQNVLRNDETILSRLGVAQNRLPRGRKGIRNRRLCNIEPTKTEVLQTVKTRSKVGRVITTNVMDPVEPIIPRPPTNSRIETLSCTFDEDFYENVCINVRKNLSCHLDGKLEGGPTSPSPISPFPSFPAIRSTVVKSPLTGDSEIHEATNLSAVTAFPTLLTAEQYGSDLAGHAKIRKPITKHSWKWKWDCVKKYKYVNEGGKIVKKIKQPMMGSRDLSKLDMWTQLTMRTKHEMVRRQVHNVNGLAATLDLCEVAREEKIKQIGELNTILDTRRLPQIILEQSDQTIIKIEIPEESNLAISTSPTTSLECIPSISSNCDYENFPQCLSLNRRDPQSSGSQEDIVLSGEWARPRSYICFGCGAKFDKLKSLEEHKIFRHPYVYSTHYEIVGRELIEGDLYKHFYIPTRALNRHREYRLRIAKQADGDSAKVAEACTCGDESMDSINSAPVSCSTTSRSDCELECKTVFASTSSSVTTSIEIEEESIIQFTGKFSGSCTKCNRECHGILDLYRHILDCSGDYAWILAKKRKYRYFGSRKRKHARHNLALARRTRALIKREKTNDDSPQKAKNNQAAPRPPRPSDAESIRRMLENLPAKRACRQIIPNITKPRARKNQNAIGKKKGLLVKGRKNTRRAKGNVASTTVTAISKNILRSHKRIYTRRLHQVRNNRTRSSIKNTEDKQQRQQKQKTQQQQQQDQQHQQIEVKSSSVLEDAQSSNVSKDNSTEKGVIHNIGRKTKRFVKKLTQKFQSNKRLVSKNKKDNDEKLEDDVDVDGGEIEAITENSKVTKKESAMKSKKVMKNTNLLRKFSFRKSSRKDLKDTKPNKKKSEEDSTEETANDAEEESKVVSTETEVAGSIDEKGASDKKLLSSDENLDKKSDEATTEPKKLVKKKSLKKILNKIKEKTKKQKTDETESNINDSKESNDQDKTTNGNAKPFEEQTTTNSDVDAIKNHDNPSSNHEKCDNDKEDKTSIEININDEPLNLSIPVQPILQVSPTTKRRGKKLNDCIAMLTGKLQEKLGKPFFESNENLDSALSAISRQSSTTDISNYQEQSSVHSASIIDIPIASSNECINFRQSAEDLSEFDKKNQKSAKRKTVTRRIIKKNNAEDLSSINTAGSSISNNTSYDLTVTKTSTITSSTSSIMTTITTTTITTTTTTSSSSSSSSTTSSSSFGYDPSKCVLLKPPVLRITTADLKSSTTTTSTSTITPQKEKLFAKNKSDQSKLDNIQKIINNVASFSEINNKTEINILSRNNLTGTATSTENLSHQDLSGTSMQFPPQIIDNTFGSLLDLRLLSRNTSNNEDTLNISADPLVSSTPKTTATNTRGRKAVTRKGVKKKQQNSELNMLSELSVVKKKQQNSELLSALSAAGTSAILTTMASGVIPPAVIPPAVISPAVLPPATLTITRITNTNSPKPNIVCDKILTGSDQVLNLSQKPELSHVRSKPDEDRAEAVVVNVPVKKKPGRKPKRLQVAESNSVVNAAAAGTAASCDVGGGIETAQNLTMPKKIVADTKVMADTKILGKNQNAKNLAEGKYLADAKILADEKILADANNLADATILAETKIHAEAVQMINVDTVNVETLPPSDNSNKQTKTTLEKEENLREPIILVENDTKKLLEIEDTNKTCPQIELTSTKDKPTPGKKLGKKKLETKISKLQQKTALDLLDMTLPKTHDIVKDIPPTVKKRKSIKNLTVETQNLENSTIDMISDMLPISEVIKMKKLAKVITKKLSPNHEIEQDPRVINKYECSKEQAVVPENIGNEICAGLNETNVKIIDPPAVLEVIPVTAPPVGKKKPGRKPKIKDNPPPDVVKPIDSIEPVEECSNKDQVKKKPDNKEEIKKKPDNKEKINKIPDNKEDPPPIHENNPPCIVVVDDDNSKIDTIKETKKYTRKTSLNNKKTENIKTKQSDGITLKPTSDSSIDENNSDNDISTITSIVPEEVTLTDFKLPHQLLPTSNDESPVNNLDKAVKSKKVIKNNNKKDEKTVGGGGGDSIIIKTGRKSSVTSLTQVDKQNNAKNNETPAETGQNIQDTIVVKRRSNRNKTTTINDENKEKILELQRALSEAEEIIASFLSDDLDLDDSVQNFKDKPTRLDEAESILIESEDNEIFENRACVKDSSVSEPSTSNLQVVLFKQNDTTEDFAKKLEDKTAQDLKFDSIKENDDVEKPKVICKEFYINLQDSQQDILQYQEKVKAGKLLAQSTMNETEKSTNESKFTIATRKGARRKTQVEIECETLSETAIAAETATITTRRRTTTTRLDATQESESQEETRLLKEDNKVNDFVEAVHSAPPTPQKRGGRKKKDLQQNAIDIISSASSSSTLQGNINQNTAISIDAADSAAAISSSDINKKSQSSKNVEENDIESITSSMKITIPSQQQEHQEHETPPSNAHLDDTSILSNLKSQDGSDETDMQPQRPDSAAKKQRKRRKNELAAIVADQLLESFKEVDKSRLDDLKMLENLAYEKSEDLLLTGMRLTPTTKRKNSLPDTTNQVTIKPKQNDNCKMKIRSRSQPNTKTSTIATDEQSLDATTTNNKNDITTKKRKISDSKLLNIHENLFRSMPKCDEPLKLNVEPMSQKHNFRIGSNFNTTQFEVFSTFKSSFDNFRSLTDFSFMTRKDSIRKSNFVPGSAETSNSVDSHSLRLQEDLTKSNDASEKSKQNFAKKLKKKLTRKKEKLSDNENINELRSGLESFTFGKEIQGDVAVKAFGFFSSANRPGIIARSLFSTSTPELSLPFNKLNETQTVSLQAKKPFLRPSILTATLDTSKSVSVSENNLQTENIKHVSSRDPRLNKNKRQPQSDKEDNYEPLGFEKRKLGSLRLRRKSERDTSSCHGLNKNSETDELNMAFLRPRERLRSSRRIKDLKSFKNDTKKNQKGTTSDIDDNSQSDEDDNYLAQIAKSVNDKILSSDNEDDGFEMANSTAAALLLASERPPRPSTSMSLRSMPNFNDDQSNADFLHEDENTNTELIDMDLEDDISCYTSFSQDVSRFRRGGKLGMRRRRRKSILLTRKPKKTNFADTSLEEFHCDMCNKTFRKAIALSKHQMTLSHIAKLSEYEYLNASKQAKEPSPKPTIEEKETHHQQQQQQNYPIELSPSPEVIDIETEQPEPAEELVDEGEATAAMPVETEVPTAIPEDVAEKPNTPRPVVVNLLSQSGIEPISSPEQVETNYERYNNTSSRIALSQEERLFYECCNMLKGSETPMVERTYPVLPSTFSAYDVPNKPVTPKSSERFSYLGSEASGSFHHGTAYTVKSPMSQSRTSPRHAYPKIDINQFSDISSDSNPAFPRAQPHPNLQSNLNNYPGGNMLNHKYPPYNNHQSPLRDGNVQTAGLSTFVPEIAARSYQGAYYTGETSFTPAQFPIGGGNNRTVASLTARTFVNDDPGKSFVPLRESATMPGYPLDMQERNRDVIGQQQTFTSPLHSTSSQGSTTTTTTCRMKTKAAMKGYDNFKVSIPTLGLDMQQALERSPHGGCKLTALAEIALGSEAPITPPTRYPPTTPVRDEVGDKTKSKPDINEKFAKKYQDLIKSNIKPPAAPKVIKKKEYSEKTGNKLGFKAKKNKQKTLKSTQVAAEKPPEKPKDVYEFDDSEEMVQNIVKSPSKGRNAKANEEKIIIPERPFKNIGLDEQQAIKFHKPEGNNEKTEEDSLSTTSYSDRDDFNYGSMSEDNEEQENADENEGSSDSESNSSARTAKTIENKCLIMGRIFKNATKNRAEEKNKEKATAEPKKKIPVQELDKLFDKLREDPEPQRETSTPKVDSTLKETEKVCAEEEEEEQEEVNGEMVNETPEVAPAAVVEENHKEETVQMDIEGDQTVVLPETNNDGEVEKDEEASENNDNTNATEAAKDKRKKPRLSRKDTQQHSKEIYRLQSELGMSAEEIAELIGEGQRKSQRRCAANQTRKFVEIWSSDEYEEFLSTKDVIAFIEEKEKKSRKRKSGSRNNEKKKSFDSSSRLDVSASATNTQDKIEKIDKENQEIVKDDKSIKSKPISSSSNNNKKPEKIVDKLLEKLSKPQKGAASTEQQEQQEKSQQPQKDGIKKPTQNSTKHEKDTKKPPPPPSEKVNKTSASQKKPTLSVKPRIKNKNEDSESDFETEWRGGGRSRIKKRRKTICFKEQENGKKLQKPADTTTTAKKPTPTGKGKGNNKLSENSDKKSSQPSPAAAAATTEPTRPLARRKRVASEMLYYWSSSSDEEFGRIETRDDDDDDDLTPEGEHYQQHGWIVGDSHKKLVTLLAIAKGKKVEDCGVKETVHKKKS